MQLQDDDNIEPNDGRKATENTPPVQQTSLEAFRPPAQRLAESGKICELCGERAPPDETERRQVTTPDGIPDPNFKIDLCNECAEAHTGAVKLE